MQCTTPQSTRGINTSGFNFVNIDTENYNCTPLYPRTHELHTQILKLADFCNNRNVVKVERFGRVRSVVVLSFGFSYLLYGSRWV